MPAMPSRRQRQCSGTLAVLGWFALALQLWLTIRLSTTQGRSAAAALWQWLGYFTITTNGLVAAVLSAAAWWRRHSLGRWLAGPRMQGMAAMSIAVVGLIYNLVLRQLWQPQGWQWLADVLLHDAMPLLFLLHWWLGVPTDAVRWRWLASWLVYPAAYLVYAMSRGAVDGWYPYPFLDVATLGYGQVAGNAALVLLAFLAVAAGLIATARWRARRSMTSPPC